MQKTMTFQKVHILFLYKPVEALHDGWVWQTVVTEAENWWLWHRVVGGNFEAGLNDGCAQRDTENVCENICQLICTSSEHSTRNVVWNSRLPFVDSKKSLTSYEVSFFVKDLSNVLDVVICANTILRNLYFSGCSFLVKPTLYILTIFCEE